MSGLSVTNPLGFTSSIDAINLTGSVVNLFGGSDFFIITDDNWVADGQSLTVNASALRNTNTGLGISDIFFDATAETDGSVTFIAPTSNSISVTVVGSVLEGNIIDGSNNADTLIGGNVRDIIDGKGGNDLIQGLGGNDELTGGTGNDRFIFEGLAAANGVDTITDFTTGTYLVGPNADRLEVNAFTAGFAALTDAGVATIESSTAWAIAQSTVKVVSETALLDFGVNGTNNLTVADFSNVLGGAAFRQFGGIGIAGKSVILSLGSTSSKLYFIDTSLDGSVATVGAGDIRQVAVLEGITTANAFNASNFLV